MAEKPFIAILGGGESGTGAALLAQKKGFRPWLSDAGRLTPAYAQQLQEAGIRFQEGGHDKTLLLQAETVIKSPGIPQEAAPVQWAREAGIPVISEVEWASRFCPGTMIAITGTNGKTTTTLLIHHLLKKAGLSVVMAGNMGKSFAAALLDPPADYYVLEVSSFQLDDIQHFHPHIAVITNITPDHLERYHHQLERYAAAKFRICENQGPEDHLLLCADDALTQAHKPPGIKAQIHAFTLENRPEMAAYENEQKQLTIQINPPEAMTIEELALQGKHNRYNSMAAGMAGSLLNIRKETIRDSLAGFENIEHRLEHVLQIYGIDFINDSKATNVNSTWYALENMSHPTVWIAGGVDKGNDYSQLIPLVQKHVKALVCLGTHNEKLMASFSSVVPDIVEAQDMGSAVQQAYRLANKGDAVLLSPACASFDLFESFEDRGRQFKNAVRQL